MSCKRAVSRSSATDHPPILADGAQLAHQAGQLGALREDAGVAIQVLQLLARPKQRHVLRLAVHVHQLLAQLLQNRERHAATVDARAAASRRCRRCRG